MSQILGIVMLVYFAAAVAFVMAELWFTPQLKEVGSGRRWGLLWLVLMPYKAQQLWGLALLLLGLAFHTGALLWRWVVSYRQALESVSSPTLGETLRLVILQVPLSNFYESLIFFSWSLPFLGIVAFRRNLIGWLGSVVAMAACLLLAYASLGVDSAIKPLMPALKSNWLLIHVFTCFLGYAAFTVAFGSAILYLLARTPRRWLPDRTILDHLIYRATILGFILLTLGILTGAVWAETAWGRYWSWDPKEVASGVTWLIYAALFHARLTKGWQGRRIAWLAVLGFVAVLFTYFGVSFLLPGLHSYLK
jgi:cytochrome c-type biogenesis protein CcsB